MSVETAGERETGRLEAFSDGVFAFAITLLVLGLHDPLSTGSSSLFWGLLGEWPTFFAFVTSFATELIMWMNHHNMFNYINRIDREFMLLNGMLLFFITLTPFTTSLVADHILDNNATTAALAYSGGFLLLSLVWNTLWRYASSGQRLMGKQVSPGQVTGITRQYYVGPVFYSIAFIIAFFSALASLVTMLLVAAFYALTATMSD
jgi:uncharacterized membrane protein